jgi:ABC-type branched-subunit amino acid transport system substrate-binding protein
MNGWSARAARDGSALRRLRQPRRWRRALACIAVVPALVLLAACGGSSDSGGGGSKGPVSVMLMIPLSGNAIQLPDIKQSVTAGVDDINAHGGLSGHHVNLIVCDDGYNAALTTACATKAVQQKVVAVLSAFTPYGSLVYSTLKPAGIPSIGDFPSSNADRTNPLSWPALGDADGIYTGLGLAAAKSGCKDVGMLSLDQPSSNPYINYVRAGVQSGGGKLEQPVLVPLTAVDMAPYVTRAESKPIDCLVFNLLPTNTVSVVNAAKSTGKDVKLASIEIEVAQALQQLGSKADGMIVGTPILDATLDPPADAPDALKRYAAQMKKYQPGKAADSFSLQGWEAVEMLRQAAQGLKDINPKTLVAALDKLDWKPGISGEANWGAPAPVPGLPRMRNTSEWVATVKDGKVTLTSDTPNDVADALRSLPQSQLK